MPGPDSAYNSALELARQQFFGIDGIPRRTLAVLYREFAEMIIRIDFEAQIGKLTPERAEALKRAIGQSLATFRTNFTRHMMSGVSGAARQAAAGHARGMESATRFAGVIGPPVEIAFASIPERTLAALMIRRGLQEIGGGVASTYRTLITRSIQSLSGELDKLLTSAIARGQSASRTTVEIGQLLSRNDPELLRIMKLVGPKGGRTAAAIQAGVTAAEVQAPGLSTLLSDARRIAVSEVNNAYHEANIQAMSASPVVDLCQWNLSGRHDSIRTSPDECDVFAEDDTYGYGPGVYHPDVCPSHPHPNCFLPGTRILGPITAAMRSDFDGDAVRIGTARGDSLAVTVNHPILTPRGFIPAGSLRKGDQVLRYSPEVVRSAPLVELDENEAPPLVDEVFRAFAENHPGLSVQRSPEHLHGEARFGEGDIDIVGPTRQLRLQLQSAFAKECRKLLLTVSQLRERAHCDGAASQLFVRSLASACSFVGGADDFLGAAFGLPPLPFDPSLLTDRSDRHVALMQTAGHGRSDYADILRDTLNRMSRLVAANNIVNRRLRQSWTGAGLRGLGFTASRFGSSGAAISDSDFLGVLRRQDARLVEAVHVTSVDRFRYCGTVYDAEAEGGFVVTDNILTSNCGCYVTAITLPVQDWGKPKRPVPAVESISPQAVRKIVGPEKTDNFVKRASENLSRRLASAHRAQSTVRAA